ncbi:TPA: putative metallopeptidase [Serratia marcescens]
MAKTAQDESHERRPYPPLRFIEDHQLTPYIGLVPANEVQEWFGEVPKFIITLAADYCTQCSDAEFCALVEHELYHIAQATDDFGAPKFNKEGQPVLKLRGHDVEEFVGVVRRYGASVEVQELVDAANRPAEVAQLNIARACGNCMLRLA